MTSSQFGLLAQLVERCAGIAEIMGSETSVTITDYFLSQILRSTLTWKIKLRGPKVLLCSNYSLFNTNHKKWIMR